MSGLFMQNVYIKTVFVAPSILLQFPLFFNTVDFPMVGSSREISTMVAILYFSWTPFIKYLAFIFSFLRDTQHKCLNFSWSKVRILQEYCFVNLSLLLTETFKMSSLLHKTFINSLFSSIQ